jgi:hygromycin-B 4-O-kinase
MARPDISEVEIRQAVAGALGSGDVALTAIAQGEDSQTYGVEAAGQSYVVRINRSDEGFRKDRYVHERFSSPRLPIPRVVAIGPIGDGLHFCLTERASGSTIEDQAPSEVSRLVEPLFAAWTELARCDIDDSSGYGWFDDNGTAFSESWRSYLRSEADGWEGLREGGAELTGRDPGDLLDLYRSLIDSCPEERGLVHGDFGSNNVMVAGDRVTAVLDWDHAMYGDPLFDVATARFWATWLDCMAQQIKLFDERLSHLPNYQERVLCYALYAGFHSFLEGGEHRDDVAARWCEARCRELAAARL